jgi:hypothetical protein
MVLALSFCIMAWAGLVFAQTSPSAGSPDSKWGPEESLIVDSFITQSEAIDTDDFDLFLTVTADAVSVQGNPIPAEKVFSVLKMQAQKDLADYREAYNAERIMDIRIDGDSAEFDFRDTKTNTIQLFKFTKIDGVWKWSGLN